MRAIVLKLRDYWLSVVLIAAISGAFAAVVATQQSGDPARSALAAAAWNRTLAAEEAHNANAAAAGSARGAAFQESLARDTAGRAQRGRETGRQTGPSGASSSPQSKPSAGSSSTGAPGSYVDCRTLGHAVSASDPAGDVDALGNHQLAARFGSADLTHVTVAVAGTTLCADFTSVAPPNTSTFYSLFLSQKAPNSASVRIDVGSSSIGPQRALLKYPGDEEAVNRGIVPARVSVVGNSTSFLIDRDALPSFAPFPGFLWSAEAVGQTRLISPQQMSDYAPDGYQPTYP